VGDDIFTGKGEKCALMFVGGYISNSLIFLGSDGGLVVGMGAVLSMDIYHKNWLT
jgi:hypothetical protein